MNIRKEEPKDYQEVENLTREAFWNVYRPGCVEHYVLKRYRENTDFIQDLDLVMEEDGRIIGHIMYSKACLKAKDGRELAIATMGPISIHPDYKRKGYGLRLLNYSLEKARESGIGFVCMEGNIAFYSHAGFKLASSLKVHYHGEPEESEVPYFLAQELIPGFLGGFEGTYQTPKGYYIADEDPEGFKSYEAKFPRKEKLFQEGQLPMFCQSCGMPLAKDSDCGSEKDGTISYDYCQYCYQNGTFLQDCAMEEMAEHCSEFVSHFNEATGGNMTREEYKQMLLGFFPMLKRWKKQ